jgi:hypothetical protein
MQSLKVGGLKWVAAMLGVNYIAQLTDGTVVVESSALPASGVHLKTPKIIVDNSDASLIIVLTYLNKQEKDMPAYDFTLRYCLNHPEEDAGQYVESLARAGCEDAVIGIGQKGRISLNFIRVASSEQDAVASAQADIAKVLPEASLLAMTVMTTPAEFEQAWQPDTWTPSQYRSGNTRQAA